VSRKVNFTYQGEQWDLERTLFRYGNAASQAPKVIIIAAIHGNEPSGLKALLELQERLAAEQSQFAGEVVGLIGNFRALELGRRFIDRDMNRIWSEHEQDVSSTEALEKEELKALLDELLEGEGKRFVIDLHTTSSDSDPFISMAETPVNREFAKQMKVPTVLGIEHFIKGALLEYVSNLGHVGLAFEAGQHVAKSSVSAHKAFIVDALVCAGILPVESLEHEAPLLYDIVYRHAISPQDQFRMTPGFANFSPVRKGMALAIDQSGAVNAPENGLLFMPLYQPEGDDGFFIIR
jgi:succinylglutamate desuccinylase